MRKYAVFAPPMMLVLVACNSEHSVLSPHGLQAIQIANLTWILFYLVLAVSTIVFAAVFFAIRGSNEVRQSLSSQRFVVIGGIVFPAITLTVLLGYGLWLMREGPQAPQTTRIEIIGEQWWWRVRYHAGGSKIIERANEIRIPVGAQVEFSLKSADVIHSFWIPSLGGKVDMIPGRTNSLRLVANKPGVYRGICAEYCGGAHAFMMLDVVAVPSNEFDKWQQEATTASVGSPGHGIFQAAGCGGCHTIDGTSANGTIGPNLTGFAARRFIGAGRLAMSEKNLAQFIVDSQKFKPGNKMPPFKVFSRDDLAAVAAYLMSLK